MDEQDRSHRTPISLFGRYGRAGQLGLVGTALVSVAGSLPGSPFAFKMPGAWFFGVPSITSGGIEHARALLLWSELTCGFIGILLLCRAWLTVCRVVRRDSEERTGGLACLLALWSAPLLIAPPMFSNDVYNYAAQGEMVSHHINPYLYGPGVLGASPFAALSQGIWINTPSPYGPLFNGLDGGVVQLTGHRVLASVVILRLAAVIGVALIAAFLPPLARSYGHNGAVAFSLGVLNPLVLLFLVASGHNDALMIGLLVAGLFIARRQHPILGIVLCSLAGAIKAPGLLGVVAIGWMWKDERLLRRRCRNLAGAAAIAAATFEGLSLLFGLGWGWVRTLGAANTVTTWVTPFDLIAKLLRAFSRVTHVDVSSAVFLDVAHIVGPVVAIALGVRALLQLPEIGMPRAIGISLLAIVLLGPIVQPWYLLWSLPLLATSAGPRTASAIRVLCVSVSLVGVLGLGQLTGELGSLGPLYELLFALMLAGTVVATGTSAGDEGASWPFTFRNLSWRPLPTWRMQRV
jgi:alpha-1,6-mannosyltransferase